jgi:hypothetical protein
MQGKGGLQSKLERAMKIPREMDRFLLAAPPNRCVSRTLKANS